MRSISFYIIRLLLWLILFGKASPFCDHHHHGWVRYIDNTKIMVWCISSILIHMTYSSVYKIWISEHYRAIDSYSPTPSQQVSEILWSITITVWLQSQVHPVTYYFVLMHEIFTSQNTETHYTVIILLLADFQCILHRVIILSGK